MKIEEIIENFEYLDDWEDRYKYLIELGNSLEPFPEALMTPHTKVQGCVSQVWIHATSEASADPIVHFIGTSDAHIVRGLVAVTLAIFSGHHASKIVKIDEQSVFSKLSLAEHITPQRSNGLRAMVQRIKDTAQSLI